MYFTKQVMEKLSEDKAFIESLCYEEYHVWKDFYTEILKQINRTVTFPPSFTKMLACRALLHMYEKEDECNIKIKINNGAEIAFKSTTYFFGDLTSFEDEIEFDTLIFLRINVDKDLVFIYDLCVNSTKFNEYFINGSSISLQKLFIEKHNLLPDVILDMKKNEIYDASSEYYAEYICVAQATLPNS